MSLAISGGMMTSFVTTTSTDSNTFNVIYGFRQTEYLVPDDPKCLSSPPPALPSRDKWEELGNAVSSIKFERTRPEWEGIIW